jgi:hypothetical protein
MQVRAQEIFKSIKNEIKCVNDLPYLKWKANHEREFQELDNTIKNLSLIKYIREIVDVFFDPEQSLQTKWRTGKAAECDHQMFLLFLYLLKAVLTDTYKMGQCHEFASLGLMRLLKRGIKNNIEVVTVIDSSGDNHTFLVLDRDLKLNITVLPDWIGVIKFDPWGESEIKSYDQDEFPTKASLGAGELDEIVGIQVQFCWNRNLTQDDFIKLIAFLENIKKYLTEDLLTAAAQKSGRGSINEQELESIRQKIDQEVLCLESLIKSPPLSPEDFMVRHYKSDISYSTTMFKIKPFAPNPSCLVIKNQEFKLK